MKITIIGAGNVGGLAAMRILQEGLGEVVLLDIVKGLACAKAFDLQDCQGLLKYNYSVTGTDDFHRIQGSQILVITAGKARTPGMTREDLLQHNAAILKDISVKIKTFASEAVVIVVTNPVDLLTRFVLEETGFSPRKVLGMGLTLDASRFVNLISEQLKIPLSNISASVIGSHGQAMLPLPRFTTVEGVTLDELMDEKDISGLLKKTIERGKEIVSLLGSGSAYFAPSAAIAELVRCIAKDQKRCLGVSVYLNSEYGLRGVCIGVPCRLGKAGIEQVIELDLSAQEKQALQESAAYLKEQYKKFIIKGYL